MNNFHAYIARKRLLQIHGMYTTKNPLCNTNDMNKKNQLILNLYLYPIDY